MKINLSRRARRLAMLMASFSLCFVISACADGGDDTPAPDESVQASFSIPSLSPMSDPGYPDVRVYFDGLLSDKAYHLNDTVYLSPDAICSFLGMDLSVTESAEGFTLSVPGLDLTGASGQEYMRANYRYLYTPESYLSVGGKIYLSCDVMQRVFGLSLTVVGDPARVEIDTGVHSLIQGGENYYDVNFPTEDVFWLTHIINAEALGQPLAGMIGVGNVVFNRVKSDIYPDTVMTVIFDRENAVQFDPVATGDLYQEPDEMSFIATYLCLEGYNTVGESMYFVNPAIGNSYWFESALTYVTTIGGHDFYA